MKGRTKRTGAGPIILVEIKVENISNLSKIESNNGFIMVHRYIGVFAACMTCALNHSLNTTITIPTT